MQDILDVWQLVVAAACLLGDSDAMSEHDLIVAILRVLHVLGVLHVHGGALVFDLSASRQVEVHGAEGRGGDVDVIDVVEHHWLVRVGQG